MFGCAGWMRGKLFESADRWHPKRIRPRPASVRRIEDVAVDDGDAAEGVGPGRAHGRGVVVEGGARQHADLLSLREFGINLACQLLRLDPGPPLARRVIAAVTGEGELAAISALVGILVNDAAQGRRETAGTRAVDDDVGYRHLAHEAFAACFVINGLGQTFALAVGIFDALGSRLIARL